VEKSEVKENWSGVLKLVIPYFLVVGLFQYIGILILGLHFDDLGKQLNSLQTLWIMVCTAAGTFLVVWLFRRYRDKGSFASLGFNYFRLTDVIWGLVMGAIIMASGYAILIAAGQITYLNSTFVLKEMMINLLFLILVAFTEELLMRGYILKNLIGSMNKYGALAVSSCLFSMMHIANADYTWFAAVELFFAGILLGLSYLYTRNLWFPIALHFSWNFFQGAIFGFNVSGRHIHSMINHMRIKDNIWNGGAFGFEGSLLSLFFQLAGIVIIYLLFRKRESTLSADPQR
jgi:membrane protease YdiL (CAAX protease family)